MKSKFYLLLFIALFGINKLNAQSNWVTFTKATPEEPTVTLQQSNISAVIFNVETSGMFAEDISKNGAVYQRLKLPKQTQTIVEGEPELPIIRQMIAIPECNDVNISINTNTPTVFDNYTVYPSTSEVCLTNKKQRC